MFCNKCGNKLSEDASFCHKCGVKVNLQKDLQDMGKTAKHDVVGRQTNEGAYCPKCKSRKLQVLIESKVEGKGGGYGTGKGCLGWLLFGPLGLLLGIFGNGTKITTTNETFFICMDCSNKFREAKELMEEKSRISGWSFISAPFAIVFGIIALFYGLIFPGLILVALGGLAVFGGFSDKKASEEIQSKKYDAEVYKEKKRKRV
ncbi:zinc ribbon domain-containing protein [Anaeromusa acidaminophila]|uniref:zinc ribbon domain-containing protein n=1 Tax=Anaeromusa acidaminophila TaxID=81464 RepID=UPI00037CAA9E|nr:zinc ribbon domain-containing protein [Anaeromusa acidaminophila]